MKTETTQREAVVLQRLVRFCGFEVCWIGMMGMILIANTKSAGWDALLVAVFAWSLGYGTGRFFLKSNPPVLTPKQD